MLENKVNLGTDLKLKGKKEVIHLKTGMIHIFTCVDVSIILVYKEEDLWCMYASRKKRNFNTLFYVLDLL